MAGKTSRGDGVSVEGHTKMRGLERGPLPDPPFKILQAKTAVESL
jgi:hypothetical protein